MDHNINSGLAIAVERLTSLGFEDSANALIKYINPKLLTKKQLRKFIEIGEARQDLDLTLKMTRHLIVKLKSATSNTERRELASLVGSEMGGLSLLHNLPKELAPITPIAGRVCYVLHHSLPYYSNGYAIRGHGLCAGMQAAGIDLVCLTRPGFPLDIKRDLKEAPLADQIDDITYHRIREPKWTGPGRSRTYSTDAADALEEAFRQHRPQVVIAASNHVNALSALIAARRCGIPMAYEVRGFWEITKIKQSPGAEASLSHQAKVRLEAKLAAMSDKVFTLSDTMKQELIRRKVPAHKISLIPNCCSQDLLEQKEKNKDLANLFSIPVNVPVIGYIGSFVDYEGLDDLVSACAALRHNGHLFRLVLVGASDGPVYEKVRQIAAANGLGDWLILPGRVPNDEVQEWYSLIDVAAFPRKPMKVTEIVTPLKPLEAMAMGKAVVMSSVAAMAEMVEDGVTGVLFEKGNIQALSEVLGRLVKDSELRSSLGGHARAFVDRERTWPKMGQRVLEWVNSVVEHENV